jgi:hypothetical protein
MTRVSTLLMILLGLVLVAGCGGSTETAIPPAESYVKELTIIYGGYTSARGGKRPTTQDEFKAYVVKTLSAGHDKKTPEEIEQLLKSPRDNQPYKFVLGGSDAGAMGQQSPVLYEAVGVEGKRVVGYSLGKIELLDEAQFKTVIPEG